MEIMSPTSPERSQVWIHLASQSFWSMFTWMCVSTCSAIFSMVDIYGRHESASHSHPRSRIVNVGKPTLLIIHLTSPICHYCFPHLVLGTWQSQLFTKPCHNRDTQLAESDAGISIQGQGILEVFLLLSWSIYSCRRSSDFIISSSWRGVGNISAHLLRWIETQLTSRMVTLLGLRYT